MNSERWEWVKRLLDEAILISPADRSAYLDLACGTDLELRNEVESLLAAHENAGTGFLNSPAVDLKAGSASSTPRVGRRIGVYQIVEPIGHGGMGEVYRAIRADGQYAKEVAIKLVRGGYDTASVVERFRNERQILASLDHPNIARLLDGGTTEDGTPYLVMELIEGTCIDAYCDAHRLSVTGRLQLFRHVCSAVQYAHQRLVIHRDIKPSNILVTKEGVPKLLDFGIAKILNPSAESEPTLTRAMTPEYASPEQIRAEPITTASDIYSLGVVLYQLLTGRSPYPGDTRSSHELARAVCDTEPGRPSTAVLKPLTVRSGNHVEQLTPEQLSGSREGSPAKLQRRLAGDLDNIVLIALRKKPEERYVSVERFANDLRCHLEGLPVTARKTSWDYRAAKFVGRHRIAALATAIAFLILLAGAIVIARESRLAAENGRRAEQRFNDVRQLTDSLMFEVHDSIQDLPGATPARKLIVQRSLEYLNRLAKDSSGDISLQRELANAYERIGRAQGDPEGSNLGDTAGALDSFGKALSIREKIADPQSGASPADLLALAGSYREMCMVNVRYLGSVGNALKYCGKALNIIEGLSKSDPNSSAVKAELARVYETTGRMYGEDSTVGNAGNSYAALDNHRKALALVEQLAAAAPSDLKLRSWQGRLSLLTGDDLLAIGKMSDAVPLYTEATKTFEDLRRQDNNPRFAYSLIVCYQRMGDMLLTDGHFEQSLFYYRKQLEFCKSQVAADAKDMRLRTALAAAYATNGHALWRANHVPQAIGCLRQGLKELADNARNDSGSKGLETQLVIWMAGALEKGGDVSGALLHYLRSEADFGATCKSDPSDVGDCLMLAGTQDRIARIYIQQGKLDEALAEYQKALAISEPLSTGNQPNLEALYTLVNVYYGMGDIALARAGGARGKKEPAWDQARGWYEKSHAAFLRIPGWHPITPNEFDSRSPKAIETRLSLFHSSPPRVAPSGHGTVASTN